VFKQHVIHPLQGLAGHLFFALTRLFPITFASDLGGWAGRAIGPRLGITKRARRNLRNAFPDMSESEIETVVHDMWDNLGRTVMEYPLLGKIKVYTDDAHVEVVGAEHLDKLRDGDGPGIFFSAHLANWEIPPIVITKRGLKSHIVYRAPNNPYVNDLFERRHVSDGTLIPKGPAGARLALKALAAGDYLGMIVDQKMNDGIAVPLFGRDAMTAPALAQLALKFNCPVLPVRSERLGGVSFRVTCYPPLDLAPTGDRQADVLRITTEVNRIIEGWIRQRPAQWLWLHNRWPD